ncbi:hypothetical protein HQ393_01735 [Chitinibacter bivalviorum]|uniref:Uncharacterized protein n=1 Tax=Chitinibacter bivalviorum TaxID=2739434 RepID=A0A7H9BET1_9NEIS|nr:hypothetical protein [Chitinibacter bivalviorum]QLG87065.1 hypothetical protein HQ393_01735 [Chitinibacter bivalviorum]
MRKPSRNTAIQERAFSSRRAASLLLMSRYTRSDFIGKSRPPCTAKSKR